LSYFLKFHWKRRNKMTQQ